MKRFAWLIVLLLLFGGAALVFAQEAKAPSPPSPADSLGLKGIVKGVVVGALVGLTVAFLGFAKDKNPDKKFNLNEAAPTILLGIAIGGLFGWDQKDVSNFKEWKDAAAAILIGELGLKAGWRNLSPIISNVSSVFLGRKSG